MKFVIISMTAVILAVAPEATSAAAADGARCELHFWPTEKAQSSNYSGVGGIAGAVLKGKRPVGADALLADLPPEAQVEAIRGIDLASLLAMPDVVVILQHAPLATKTATSRKTRLTASTEPCYAELAVKRMGYRSHITAGRDFGAIFILRRYESPGTPARIEQGGADVSMKLYPARTEEERPAATAELRDKFGRVAEKFLTSKGR